MIGTLIRGLGLAAALAAGLVGAASAQVLRIGVATHPSTLDVQKDTGNDAAQFLYNVFDTLIERDPFAAPLKFSPGLATAWKQTEPTAWDVTLREGVQFHDGAIMTAEDVAYSLNRVFQNTNPAFASANGRFFYNFDRVEVTGPLSVRIHTRKPEPLFEVLLSARNAGITRKAHVEGMDLKDSFLKPVGTGPYRVTRFEPGRETVMERFDGFWGEAAPLAGLHYVRIPEVSARITALVNNEVDFAVSIPPDQEALIPRDRFTVSGITWPMFHVMVLNMSHPVLADARIRQALNLAIDRDTLTEALWAGKGLPARAHQFPEYGAPLYIEGLRTIGYDKEKARQLVREAGYKGEPIRITYQHGYYLYFDLAAQAVQAMWQEIGLNVELQQVEKYPADAEVMIRPWSNPMYYPDPMGAMDTHWSDASWTARRGYFKPASTDWAPLYETARFATDPMARRAAYEKLVALGEQEAGWILLYQPWEAFAMSKSVSWPAVPTALRPYTLTFRAGQVSLGSN